MGTTRVKIVDLSQEEVKKVAKSEPRSQSEREKKISSKAAAKTESSIVIANDSEAILTGSDGSEKIASSANDKTHNDKIDGPESEKTDSVQVGDPEHQRTRITKTKIVKPKKASAPKKHIRGKKYQEAANLIDKTVSYKTAEAFEILRKVSFSKFDSTVELHINVVDKNIRGKVVFPFAVANKTKEKKYLIFSDKQQTVEGKQIIWGSEKTIAEIEKGQLKPGKNFDVVITSAKFMPALARVAKVLGPRGMMPNPKNGTITDDPTKILAGTDEGATEYRTDPTAPIVHTKLGKLSNKDEELSENMKALFKSIGATKIKKAIIKSTMSPAIKIDVMSVGK